MSRHNEYFRQVGKYLSAARLLWKVDLAVRTEDEEDIPFWQAVISAARPGLKLKFLPWTRSISGAKITGKKNCLKYAPSLNKHFVIAVDADFDILLGNDKIFASPFVFHTVTYSWENHHCLAENLQRAWEENFPGATFSFRNFLGNLSHNLYEPFVRLLIKKSKNSRTVTLDRFDGKILSVQPNRPGCLDDDGSPFVTDICDAVVPYVSQQSKDIDNETVESYAFVFSSKGLRPESTYLYMQGHCIYNLISRIGGALSGSQDGFIYSVLLPALRTSGYPEMDTLISRIRAAI